MTECKCSGVKQILMCGLERAGGPCRSTNEPPTGQTLGLGSDALLNSIAAQLGATTTTEL
jgi:hypothetical protein